MCLFFCYLNVCCEDCNTYSVYDPCDNPYFFQGTQKLWPTKLLENEERRCRRQPASLASGSAQLPASQPAPQASRYSFQHNSIIEATIISTEPVEIVGTVRARSAGYKWIAMTEFQLPLFFGGGELRVENGFELVLGLDSSLSVDGAITVDDKSTVRVPRHGSLTISNHTVTIPRGSQLNVDGSLVMGKAARMNVCGSIRTQTPFAGVWSPPTGPGELHADGISSLAELCREGQ
jgi:hypothetical protein